MIEWLGWAYDHLSGEFGLGIVLGMLVLAFWDPDPPPRKEVQDR